MFSDHARYTSTRTWQQHSCFTCWLLARPWTVWLNEATFNKLIIKFLPLNWSCWQTPACVTQICSRQWWWCLVITWCIQVQLHAHIQNDIIYQHTRCKVNSKVNVDLYSASTQTPLTRSDMDHTVSPANNTISAFTPQSQSITALWPVLIAPTYEGMARLSWPGWLVKLR